VDPKLKKNLILVGVILVCVVGFYFLFSPFQRCLRERVYPTSIHSVSFCDETTDW